jgi:hypothetical protein
VRPYTNQYKNIKKNKLAGKTKIPLIYYKIFNNSFESIEVHVQANIYDLYDFDYSAPTIMGYDLAQTAATLQIGAVRGVDQIGKIFQVECIIDKIESPLIWEETVFDGQI